MTDEPITVTESPWPSTVAMAFRQLGLIGAGITTITGLVKSGSIPNVFAYISGDDGSVFIAAVVTVGIAAYGWIKGRIDKARTVALANLLPDSKAVVK